MIDSEDRLTFTMILEEMREERKQLSDTQDTLNEIIEMQITALDVKIDALERLLNQ